MPYDFRRYKAREDFDCAGLNNEIVIATPKINSAHFLHSKTPTFSTIIKRKLLQCHDAMGNALELDAAFPDEKSSSNGTYLFSRQKTALEQGSGADIAKGSIPRAAI